MKHLITVIISLVLLSVLIPVAAAARAGTRAASIDLSATELVFSGIKSTTVSPTDSVTIKNLGDTDLTISDISLAGTYPNHYRLVSPPTLPVVILPGDSLTVGVGFKPLASPVGIANAILQIDSDDAVNPVMQLPLYGLVANGLEGGNEPTLNNVVKTLGININVGFTTLTCGSSADACAPLLGEEIAQPIFLKAGGGVVTMTAVGRYSPDLNVKYGYYTPGNTAATTQLGTLAKDSLYPTYNPPNYQKLNPSLMAGSLTTFDPGANPFGIYVVGLAGRFTYSQDSLNAANPDAPTIHAVRVFPVRNRAGTLVPNSYLLVFEDASNGDYQDYMFVLSNVKNGIPPTPTPTNTFTRTPTRTKSPTPTKTFTSTPTSTATATSTPTATATATFTSTATDTPTASNTPVDTPTDTLTSTPTETFTSTPTATDTVPPTETPTETPSPTLTLTPTETLTPTITPTIDPSLGTELVVNGSFEDNLDGDKIPDSWKANEFSKDGIACNSLTKIVAYVGTCAFRFKGGAGENARLGQILNLNNVIVVPGDLLSFSTYTRGSASMDSRIKIKIRYLDVAIPDTTIKADYVSGLTYNHVAQYVMLEGVPSKIKVLLRNTSLSGKSWIDGFSVKWVPGGSTLNARTLPLPLPGANNADLSQPPASGLTGRKGQ